MTEKKSKKEEALDNLYPKPPAPDAEPEKEPDTQAVPATSTATSAGLDPGTDIATFNKSSSFDEHLEAMATFIEHRCEEMNPPNIKDGSAHGVHIENTRLMSYRNTTANQLRVFAKFIRQEEIG